MLSEGVERCPVCGARLPPAERPAGGEIPASEASAGQKISRSETLGITAYLLSVLLIPLVVIIFLGLVCAVVVNLGN
jgi:hypothetical protein